jgi:hypothetical protein
VYACQKQMRRHETETDGFLKRRVTGHRSWVLYYKPQIKKTSNEGAHQNPKNSVWTQVWESDADAVLGSPRALHIQGDHSHQCPALQQASRVVLLLHDNSGPQLRRSGVFTVNVSLISRTPVTSPLVTAVPVGNSCRLLLERLFDPVKKCNRWCMSGYACRFFHEESMR